ncbi:hypothetical protein [Psychromonas aquimarina]|uniref:hypothetical protein n=1 Tax=Psychromonas aquimarina TaxID=444919 RepID=UPI000406E8C2|nr:hypothetical protein [Psychromonas aquimarina]
MKNFILEYGEGNSQLCGLYNELAFYCVAGKYLRIVSITEDKVIINKLTGKRDIYEAIPVSDDGEWFYLCEKIYSLKTGKVICKLEGKPPTEKWLNAFFTEQYLYTPVSPGESASVIKKDLVTFNETMVELGEAIYRSKNCYIAITDTKVECREINTDIKQWTFELDKELVEPGWLIPVLTEKYVIFVCHDKYRVLILDLKTGEQILYNWFAELLNEEVIRSLQFYYYNDRLYLLGGATDKNRSNYRNFLAYYDLPGHTLRFYDQEKKLGKTFFVNKHGVFVSADRVNPFVLNHDLDEIIYDPKLEGPCGRIDGNDDYVLYGQGEGGALVIDCR